MSTSGSTGRPAIFLRSPREEAELSARWARVYAAYGCGPFVDQANIASGLNRTRRGAIDLLRRVRPTILTGYAVAIEALAERALAARAFRSAVSNAYVTNEVGVIAWSCPARHDALHLNEDALLVEVVDDQGRPVPEGTCGELLVTPLALRAMPLLRYRNGDLATRLPGACSYGRGLALITPVQGRTAHTIRGSRGELVTAPLVARRPSVRAAPTTGRAASRCARPRRRSCGCSWRRRARRARQSDARCSRGIQAVIGPGHSVGLEIVPSLPLAPSGKFQHVVPRAAGHGQRPPQAA